MEVLDPWHLCVCAVIMLPVYHHLVFNVSSHQYILNEPESWIFMLYKMMVILTLDLLVGWRTSRWWPNTCVIPASAHGAFPAADVKRISSFKKCLHYWNCLSSNINVTHYDFPNWLLCCLRCIRDSISVRESQYLGENTTLYSFFCPSCDSTWKIKFWMSPLRWLHNWLKVLIPNNKMLWQGAKSGKSPFPKRLLLCLRHHWPWLEIIGAASVFVMSILAWMMIIRLQSCEAVSLAFSAGIIKWFFMKMCRSNLNYNHHMIIIASGLPLMYICRIVSLGALWKDGSHSFRGINDAGENDLKGASYIR